MKDGSDADRGRGRLEEAQETWMHVRRLLERPPADWTDDEKQTCADSLEQLTQIFEELQVADEELREQGEALEAANVDLDAERRRFRELFDSAPDAYIVTDGMGMVREANAAAARLLGTDAVRLLGRPIVSFAATEDRFRFREKVAEAARGQSVQSWDGRLRTRSDREIEAEFHVVAARDGEGLVPSIRWIVRDVTEMRKAEAEIRNSRSQLRALATKLQSAREDERARIAREIHDQLGGDLTALKLEMQSILRSLDGAGPETARRGERMGVLIDGAIETVRDLASQLRPRALDLGLVPALEWLMDEFRRRTGLAAYLTAPERELPLDGEMSASLFRMVQESLTNVARHARATEVRVSVERRAGEIGIEVRDDGQGVTPAELQNPDSLGLAGLRERALALAGEVRIEGEPGKGTTVSIRAPLPAGDGGRPGRERETRHPGRIDRPT